MPILRNAFALTAAVGLAFLTVFATVAEARSLGGRSSSSGFRSSGTFRTSPGYRSSTPSYKPSPAPSYSPSRPSYPTSPRPSYSPSANRIPAPRLTPQGGAYNNAYGTNYRSFGYNPTQQQSSMLSNPWMWMYLMSGHGSSASAAPSSVQPDKLTQSEIETNCRAAATQTDKPSDLKPEDCTALAEQAFRKVQAESKPAQQTYSTEIDGYKVDILTDAPLVKSVTGGTKAQTPLTPPAEPTATGLSWISYTLLGVVAVVLVLMGINLRSRRPS